MLSHGFEKTAAHYPGGNPRMRENFRPIEHLVTTIAGLPVRLGQRGKEIRKRLQHFEQSVGRGVERAARYNPATGRYKPILGEGYAGAKERSALRKSRESGKPIYMGERLKIHETAKEKVKARHAKSERERSPSFWQRHPVATALTGAAAHKALFGGGDKKEQSEPYVVYPNQ